MTAPPPRRRPKLAVNSAVNWLGYAAKFLISFFLRPS